MREFVYTHVHLYTYICIHTYTHKLSSRVLFCAEVLLFFPLSFSTITTRSRIRYRNAFHWWGRGSEGRRETALVGKSSSDTQTFAESTSTTSCLCFEHVHTYIHMYIHMYSCTHTYIYVRQCFLASPTHHTPSARSAHLLVDCNYRKHSTIKEEWQKNKTEMKLFTRLLWNSLHTVARVCGLDVQIYICTYICTCMCMWVI